jgi:hypothetical protein
MAGIKNIVKGAWGHKGKIFGVGFGAMQFKDTYGEARDSGSGVVSSTMQAIADGFISSTWWGMTAEAIAGGVNLAYDIYSSQNSQMRQESANSQIPFANANFIDQPQFATMRQAGMMMARKSEYNLQQAQLGNEARFMHRE